MEFSDTSDLYQYLLSCSLRESKVLEQLRLRTAEHEFGEMITTPEQSQFLAWLVRMLGARRIIEVGVFTGYTTLAMAQATPDDAEIIACDRKPPWVEIGMPYWKDAGVDHKISVCLDDARITLQSLLDEGQAASFDFIYVDADKIHYQDYLELALLLLQPKGCIAFDNTLLLRTMKESVPERLTATTRALYEFNRALHQDARLDISMLPMGKGLTLVSKRIT